MTIYTWGNTEQTQLNIEYDNGEKWSVLVDSGSPRYAEFLASGETAAPYVEPPAPPELTTEEKINKLLSDYGLSRVELQEALVAKAGTAPAATKKK